MSPDAKRTARSRNRRFEAEEGTSIRGGLSREARRQSGRGSSDRSLTRGWALNPYLSFFLLVGVSMATFRLEHHLRLALLWLALLFIVLLYADGKPLRANYSLRNLSRGAWLGLVVALPVSLVAHKFLYATASWLYGANDLLALAERAVFLVPVLEESFFRGVVQRERGLLEGALLFGVAQALYFVTAVDVFPLVITALVAAMTLLGLLYGYLYSRHGLTASISCHVVTKFVLLVLPVLVEQISRFL